MRRKPSEQLKKQRTSTYKRPGRTGAYDPSCPDRVYQLALLGLTAKEMALAFGLDSATLYNWCRKYPEFEEAWQIGQLEADAAVARSLFHRARGYSHPDTIARLVEDTITKADGSVETVHKWYTKEIIKHYPPDTGACAFWLKNRTKNRENPWVDAVRTEHTGKDGGPIETQTKIDFELLSNEELEMCAAIGLKVLNRQDATKINDN